MPSIADGLVQAVHDAFDHAIPASFVRSKRLWMREHDRVTQAIRLERIRNPLGLPWVTLTSFLDVYPTGADRERGLVPRFRTPPSHQGRDGGFGFNFRFDDSGDVVAEKTRAMCDELSAFLAYLDRTFSQDGYLSAMPAGFSERRLEAMLHFERREELAVCLERTEWEPRPELWSAGWYGDLRIAEIVLRSYRFLEALPSPRWIAMVKETLTSINGKPSKANAERHQRVLELLAHAS